MKAKVASFVNFRNLWRVAAVTGAIVVATALMAWQHIDDSIVGLLFLTAVVWVATRAGLWLSLYMALLCALSFNYFFLEPEHSFRLAGLQEWMEFLLFIASSIIVSRIANHARVQAVQAELRRTDVERLNSLSQDMMLREDTGKLMRDLPRMIAEAFGLDAVVLYAREQNRIYGSLDGFPAVLREQMQAPPRMAAGGSDAQQEDFGATNLSLGQKNLGVLAWKPDRLTREAANAMGAQVAIAITRAQAIETYTRIEAAREGERLRTALIDSLTHELRTPLTGIRAAATTLVQNEGLDEASRHDLALLLDEESARLDRLIGEAVEMAEIDARAVTVSPVRQYPRAFLEHAVEESRPALTGHPVEIEVAEPDTPAWFDPHLLSRVVRHLAENAARYSPPGSPVVLRSSRGAGRLYFTVEDQGIGIDSTELPLIFEKFYRGKQASVSAKGTGMGLPITRAILAAHGGGIDVETTPGKGSTFRFWIPLVEKQD